MNFFCGIIKKQECSGNSECTGTTDTCYNGQCKCGSNEECTGTTNNQCVSGDCKCGANAACTATSETPFCGKVDEPHTHATFSDGDSAACYVCKYYHRIHFGEYYVHYRL